MSGTGSSAHTGHHGGRPPRRRQRRRDLRTHRTSREGVRQASSSPAACRLRPVPGLRPARGRTDLEAGLRQGVIATASGTRTDRPAPHARMRGGDNRRAGHGKALPRPTRRALTSCKRTLPYQAQWRSPGVCQPGSASAGMNQRENEGRSCMRRIDTGILGRVAGGKAQGSCGNGLRPPGQDGSGGAGLPPPPPSGSSARQRPANAGAPAPAHGPASAGP